MSEVLRVQRLHVSYGDTAAVLRDLDLEIASCETVGIFGKSGSGKTTLARAILGLLPRSVSLDGTVLFRGANLLLQPRRALRRIRGGQISLIPQEPSVALNPVMKAGRQVEDVMRAHQNIGQRQLSEASLTVLERFFGSDAGRIANLYPHQLSGGERQRVVICQAVACNPSLLIADEATSALDSIAQKAFLDLLGELRRTYRLSILLISHNLSVLRYAADRYLELREGRLSG